MFATGNYELQLHSLSPDGNLTSFKKLDPEIKSKIQRLSWSHDNKYLVMLHHGEDPEILCTANPDNLRSAQFIVGMKDVTEITFKKQTKRHLAMGNLAGELIIYNAKYQNVLRTFPKIPGIIRRLEFNHDDYQLAVLADQAMLIFSDVNEITYYQECKLPSLGTELTYVSEYPNHLWVGCEDGTVMQWDNGVHRKLKQMQKHAGAITGICASASGKRLLTSSKDYKICVMDYDQGECIFRINLPSAVNCLDSSPDGKYVVSGLEDGSMLIYDIRMHLMPIKTIKLPEDSINVLVFQNDPILNINSGTEIGSETKLADVNKNNRKPPIKKPSAEMIHKPQTNKLISGIDKERIKAEIIEKLKIELFIMMKIKMDEIETKLLQHCKKFQEYVNDELDVLNRIIKCNMWETSSIQQSALSSKSPRFFSSSENDQHE